MTNFYQKKILSLPAGLTKTLYMGKCIPALSAPAPCSLTTRSHAYSIGLPMSSVRSPSILLSDRRCPMSDNCRVFYPVGNTQNRPLWCYLSACLCPMSGNRRTFYPVGNTPGQRLATRARRVMNAKASAVWADYGRTGHD